MKAEGDQGEEEEAQREGKGDKVRMGVKRRKIPHFLSHGESTLKYVCIYIQVYM